MTEVELEVIDLKEVVLSNNSFGPSDVTAIRTAVSENYGHFGELRDAVNEMEADDMLSPAGKTKMGVCQFLLGKFSDALTTLQSADGSAMALFYQARCMFELASYGELLRFTNKHKPRDTTDQCKIGIAEAYRYAGRVEQALVLLDNIFGPAEQTARLHVSACCHSGGRWWPDGRGVGSVPTCGQHGRKSCSALCSAWHLKMTGWEMTKNACDSTNRQPKAFPTGIGVLINLGLIYEDNNQFDKAQICYKRILDCYPDHPRTRLYMKDAAATGNMLYDEEAQRRNDCFSANLNMPVTNFELSVRSRNCLQKMGIETIGDLTRTSEAELLSSKNFGETSLYEIREMLSSKGLSLGQFAHEKKQNDPPIDTSHMSPDEQALLDRPISDLNLSVRARKCMARLQINTIGELIRKTGDEMLECKNFGVTSLNEVREKLFDLGLKMRGD